MTLLLVEYLCSSPLQHSPWTNMSFVSGIRSNMNIKHHITLYGRGLVNKLARLLDNGI